MFNTNAMQGQEAPRIPHSVLFQNKRLPNKPWYLCYHGASLKNYLSYKRESCKKKSFPAQPFPSDQSLLKLPAELLHEIVSYCNTPPVLWTLMQSCSTLRKIAKPIFWDNTVWFTELIVNHKAICPVAASQVRQLFINDLPTTSTPVKQYWDSLQAAFPNLRAVCLLKFNSIHSQLIRRSDLPKVSIALDFLAARPQGIDMHYKLEFEMDILPERPVRGYTCEKLSPDGSWEIVQLKKGIHWVLIPPPAAPLGDFERFHREAGIQQTEHIVQHMQSQIWRISEIHRRHDRARERRRQLWDQMVEKWGKKGSEKRRRYEAAFLKQLERDPFIKGQDIRESWLWKDLQIEMDGFKFPEFEG